MKKILSIFACLLLAFSLTSCFTSKPKPGPSDVTNNVTNNITNNIVDYENLTIETIEQAVEACVESVQDSVIGIACKQVNTGTVGLNSFTHEDTESVGSGVIYKRVENYDENDKLTSYTYYAYTNNHVVTGRHKDKEYKFYAHMGYESVEIPCTILGKDEKQDLAVVKFDYTKFIKPVELADMSTLKKGNMVIAVGNPEGFEYYGSVSFGIISNLDRYLSFDTDNDGIKDFSSRYIQTDTAINPGNSGGGLFTLDGKLVGINTIKLASKDIDNMAFSIPADIVKFACNDHLELGKQIIRPRLGVTCVSVRELTTKTMEELGITELPNIYGGEAPYGIFVSGFGTGGSLVGSQIGVGDILLKLDGIKLTNNNILTGLLNSLTKYNVGDVVEFEYYDSSSQTIKKLNVTLKTAE